jgi:hypothetical protein
VYRKETTWKTRRRWEDNIKIDLRVIEWGGMDWIDLAQNMDQWMALGNTVMGFWVPLNIGKSLSSSTSGCFSRRAEFHGVC